MAFNPYSVVDVHKSYGGTGDFADRRQTWVDLGLGDAASYKGTSQQNGQLIASMNTNKGLKSSTPATVTPVTTAVSSLSPSSPAPAPASSGNKGTEGYQAQIDLITQKLADRGPFAYDYKSDPSYQAYAEQYAYDGERAMRDTLAQVAARTGGLASSYATSAAQQSYNDYMKRLNEQIPTLEKLAYERWANQNDEDRANLNMYMTLANNERSIQADNYDKLVNLIGDAGYTPTDAELAAAGMTRAQANSYKTLYDQAVAAAAAKAKSSGSSKSSSSGSGGSSKSGSSGLSSKELSNVKSKVLAAYDSGGYNAARDIAATYDDDVQEEISNYLDLVRPGWEYNKQPKGGTSGSSSGQKIKSSYTGIQE